MSDTKQINVRLPVELHKALDDHKVRTGEDKSDVIRRGVEIALARPGVGAAEPTTRLVDELNTMRAAKRENGTKPPKPGTADLAAYLARCTSTARVLMRSRISAGRVTVGGEVWTEQWLDRARLADPIAVDGVPVKPRRQKGQ